MSPEVQDQRVEHARRELQLHHLGRQLLADLQRLRVLRAVLRDVGQRVGVALLDRREAAQGLFRIRTGIDGFFTVVAVFTVLAFFLALFGLREIHLRGVLRLSDDVGRVRVDEPDDDVDETRLPVTRRLVRLQQEVVGRRIHGQRGAHGIEAFLDALGNADFAFAREQLHRAHLAHVHADGVGGAAELGVERSESRCSFFDGFFVSRRRRLGRQQRLGVRCLFVHRNAHVVDGVDDVLDLLGIDDLGRQVIVHLRIRQIALLLAAGDQQLELRLPVFGHRGQARNASSHGLLVDRRGLRSSLRRGMSGSSRLARGMAFRRSGFGRRLGVGMRSEGLSGPPQPWSGDGLRSGQPHACLLRASWLPQR